MPKVPEGYLRERRRHILAAASRVFSQRGVQAATMTEVANEAGISPGLIYRYFPSKDELVSCAMSESAADIETRWMEAPDASADPLGEFLELSDKTWAMLSDPQERQHTILHLEQLLTAARTGDEAEMAEASDNFDGVVTKIRLRFEAAQRLGQIDRSIDPMALAQLCFHFYWGTRIRKMVSPELDIWPSVEAFTRLLEGLKTPASVSTEDPAKK